MTTPSFSQMAATAHAVAVPLRTPFRGITTREALIFDSPDGPAEWSPFLEYEDAEAARWLGSTIEQGWRRESLSIPKDLPPTIGVNGIVPSLDGGEVAALLHDQGNPSTVKVKVAGPYSTLEADVARVSAVREVLGPRGRIRLDANGAWSLDEAEHAIRAMETLDLDYVEQPVHDLADMVELRRRITRLGIMVAADESIRRWSDITKVIEHQACDVVVLKVQPLGGLAATLKLVDQATSAGLQVVLSSAVETSVGLYWGALCQALLTSQNYPVWDAGLGTGSLLGDDVVTTPLRAHHGVMPEAEPQLDVDALARLALPAERREWWLQRLERCLALV
jgi:O-succinylbenzoate synthase